MTKAEIVRRILKDEARHLNEDDESIKLLLSKTVSRHTQNAHHDALTLGDKMADAIARIAGSWTFISTFMAVLTIWIIGNVLFLTKTPFDPYPFILLNLVLSCVAAIQAPVIMMSQNRQEKKDRIRAENDYVVNLKAELLVEDMHKKLEYLIKNQSKIMEILTEGETK